MSSHSSSDGSSRTRADEPPVMAAREEAVDRVLAGNTIMKSIAADRLEPDEVRSAVLEALADAPVPDRDWLALALVAPSQEQPGLDPAPRKVAAATIGSAAAGFVPIVLQLLGALSLSPEVVAAIATASATLGAIVAGYLTPERTPEEAKQALRERLETEVILPVVRNVINARAGQRFDRSVALKDVGGLADLFDDRYEVETRSAAALAATLSRLRAGSLGLFGPRGAGKSTLIRSATDGRLADLPGDAVLGVTVPAPVQYEAREFVPFLLGRLCLAVTAPLEGRVALRIEDQRKRLRRVTIGGAVVLAAALAIAVTLDASRGVYLAVAVNAVLVAVAIFGLRWWLRRTERLVGSRDPLVLEARRLLRALRYLETTSEEVSADVSTKFAKVGRKLGRSFAAQPLTLPEVMARYDDFVTSMVQSRGAVIIGIDELDKMATAEEAGRFLNDTKALFGRKGAFYLVSLSEDAAAAFEQRGAGLRDVFDSVFDDVLRVDPLKPQESAVVLARRVIGMRRPFAELCHAISGGLPRELLRCAREAALLAEDSSTAEIGVLARHLLARRSLARQHAVESVAARHVRIDGTQPVLTWLRGLGELPSGPELIERSDIAPVILDVRAEGSSALELESALLNLSAWWYHAGTVAQWTDRLTDDELNAACAPRHEGEPSALELLARGVLDLTVAPALAWQTVSAFRLAVGLEPRPYPLGEGPRDPLVVESVESGSS